MKVEVEIPDRYDGLVLLLARKWFNGDTKKYIHYIIVQALRCDMDIAGDEKVLEYDTATRYQEMFDRELELLST